MLVLTRKTGQKIHIGDDIVITILKVQGDQVSVGFEAPKALSIVRAELLDTARTACALAPDLLPTSAADSN